MSRSSSVLLVPSILLLVACEKPAAIPALQADLPHAELTSDKLSFGAVAWGDTATRQIQLENTGELPMGLGAIALIDDGMQENFSLSWVPADIVCPNATEGEEEQAARRAPARQVRRKARGATIDTWDTGGGGSSGGGSSGGGTGGGSSDTGGGSSGSGGGGEGGGDGGGDGEAVDDTVILDPGCKLPMTVRFTPTVEGQIFGSILVETVTQAVAEGETPAYYRDPDEFKQVVLLDGSTSVGEGNILLGSSQINMGHLYTGESAVQYVYVNNVGDGDLVLETPTLLTGSDSDADGIDDAADINNTGGIDDDLDGVDDHCDPSVTGGVDANGDLVDDACRADCDPAFSLNLDAYDGDLLLGPNSSTLFEVWYTPEDLNPAYCTISVPSGDIDTPNIAVKVQGNAGTDPSNENPVVEVISPSVGYVHTSTNDVVLELKIHDANQPADTLFCKVRSLLGETKVADCKPSDESGHVFVNIPVDLLESGTDTLLITVTDQSERLGKASTTVLWRALYPDSDDDGDGWGDSADGAYVDCDDRDTAIYPSAAELPDGKDNDCDGTIDEGTIRGDDDGDTVTEQNGDCDDTDLGTYPRAMEQADGKDNDCDGLIDEGTGVVDDDGDGFTELDLDCNDDDADINPSAKELCDGYDNNCNGYADNADPNGCEKIAFKPMIYGGVRMSKNAIGVGESTTMTVSVFDADGQPISYMWSEDPSLAENGYAAIDNKESQSITWTAPPELPEGSVGEVFSVQVLIQDPDGNQDWAFEEVWVYPEPVTQIRETQVVLPPAAACGSSASTTDTSSGAGLLPAVPLLGLLAVGRRRRQLRR